MWIVCVLEFLFLLASEKGPGSVAAAAVRGLARATAGAANVSDGVAARCSDACQPAAWSAGDLVRAGLHGAVCRERSRQVWCRRDGRVRNDRDMCAPALRDPSEAARVHFRARLHHDNARGCHFGRGGAHNFLCITQLRRHCASVRAHARRAPRRCPRAVRRVWPHLRRR
eukprot:1630737-Prymnesium_polylepis.1